MPTTVIPATALISDPADRILIAAALIFNGLVIYLTGFYKTIGRLFWQNGGERLFENAIGKNDIQKRKFERKVMKKSA